MEVVAAFRSQLAVCAASSTTVKLQNSLDQVTVRGPLGEIGRGAQGAKHGIKRSDSSTILEISLCLSASAPCEDCSTENAGKLSSFAQYDDLLCISTIDIQGRAATSFAAGCLVPIVFNRLSRSKWYMLSLVSIICHERRISTVSESFCYHISCITTQC